METLGSLVLFAVVMSFTPGPNIVMVTAQAANFGFGRTLPQMLGITAGFGAMVLPAGFGLAGMLQAEPRLHAALKYVGCVYLLYLAWCIARAGAAGTAKARARPITALEAALFTWVNPKAWVMAVGALATFTTPGGDVAWQTAVITLVNAIACFAATLAWAGFGAAIGRFLGRPGVRTCFNWTMAALLVASLLPVLW